MSATDIVLILRDLGVLATVIAAGVVSIIHARRMSARVEAATAKVDAVAIKQDEVVARVDVGVAKTEAVAIEAKEIGKHVNSAASALVKRNEELQAIQTSLLKELSDMRTASALVAPATKAQIDALVTAQETKAKP